MTSLENQDRPLLADGLAKCLELPAVKGYFERQLVPEDHVKNAILTPPKLGEALADTGYPALLEDRYDRQSNRTEKASKFRKGVANGYAITCVASFLVAIVAFLFVFNVPAPGRSSETSLFPFFFVLGTASLWYGGLNIGSFPRSGKPGRLGHLMRISFFAIAFPAATVVVGYFTHQIRDVQESLTICWIATLIAGMVSARPTTRIDAGGIVSGSTLPYLYLRDTVRLNSARQN